MRPHPRIRKTVKWGGAVVSVVLLVVSVVLLVVWVASGWWAIEVMSSGGLAGAIGQGSVEVLYMKLGRPPQVPIVMGPVSNRFELNWWFAVGDSKFASWVAMPLWAFAVPSILATALAWRRDILARRRAMVHLCQACRYDRTGLAPGAVCPECGAAAPASPPAPM